MDSCGVRVEDRNVQIGSKSLFGPVVGNSPQVERWDLQEAIEAGGLCLWDCSPCSPRSGSSLPA